MYMLAISLSNPGGEIGYREVSAMGEYDAGLKAAEAVESLLKDAGGVLQDGDKITVRRIEKPRESA